MSPNSRCIANRDPGKGITILLYSIINKLRKSKATKARLRSATTMLQGLIYSLIIQQPLLISYVREKYNHAGKQLFKDTILNNPNLRDIVLIINALNECTEGLPRLLNFIKEISLILFISNVKWIILSYNWPNIKDELKIFKQKIRLCLELNKNSISAAVQTYIHYKNLNNVRNDEDNLSLCKHVLTIVSTVYWPVTLHKLYSLIGSPKEFSEDILLFAKIIYLCSSFLTIRTKDYLITSKAYYFCDYSISNNIKGAFQEGGLISVFLRYYFLHWLKALTIEAGWDTCLQTLEGYNSLVTSVVFLPNGQRLASTLDDKTVRVWDANLGDCLQTLKGYSNKSPYDISIRHMTIYGRIDAKT
ncbi:hypothetical protein V8C34DRAFT_318967 [Trichoderma compactum]